MHTWLALEQIMFNLTDQHVQKHCLLANKFSRKTLSLIVKDPVELAEQSVRGPLRRASVFRDLQDIPMCFYTNVILQQRLTWSSLVIHTTKQHIHLMRLHVAYNNVMRILLKRPGRAGGMFDNEIILVFVEHNVHYYTHPSFGAIGPVLSLKCYFLFDLLLYFGVSFILWNVLWTLSLQ